MTISKKLSIAITLALGLQFSAGAFTGTNEDRNSIILVYAQDLRNQNNKQAETIATWLNGQVINQGGFRLAIIEVITNHNLTEQSKLTLFTAMMEKQKKDGYAEVCVGIFFTGLVGSLAYIILNHPTVFYPAFGVTHQQVNIF